MARALTVIVLALVLGAVSPSVRAGNADRVAVHGFTANADIFVFEVFGTYDSLGGGHATWFAVDLASDRWLSGTPIRVSVGDGHPDLGYVGLAEIRRRARAAAQPLLSRTGPLDPGRPMARRAFGQTGGAGDRLTWRVPRFGALPALRDDLHVLDLSFFPVDGQTGPLGTTCHGYRLSHDGVVLHADDQVPGSRGCPASYAFDSVVCPLDGPRCAALIAVYSAGLEGWDRTYIATPLPSGSPR